MLRELGMAVEPKLTELHDEAGLWRNELAAEMARGSSPEAAACHRLAQALVMAVSAASSVSPSRRGPDSYFATKVDLVRDALAAVSIVLAGG